MRRFLITLFLYSFSIHPVMGQDSLNVALQGRWGKGQCRAVYRLNGYNYTFVGNGSYLEVYKTEGDSYLKKDGILLKGVIEDIWAVVESSYKLHANVFVACGEYGVQVAFYDMADTSQTFEQFEGGVIKSFDTDGYASGVVPYNSINGERLCVADGDNGLVLVDIWNASQPQLEGHIGLSGSAHEVWLKDDNTALIAAGTAGLYTIEITHPSSPAFLDSLRFNSVFPNTTPIAYDVIANDTVAFVADGLGGMRTVDISNPLQLLPYGTWTYGGTEVDVRGITIADTIAYIVGAETQGVHETGRLYGPLNIKIPTSPTLPTYTLNTGGFPTSIQLDADTVLIGDGYNGHQVIALEQGLPPRSIYAVSMADKTYDVAIDTVNHFGYVATGKTGLKILDLTTNSMSQDILSEIGSYNTQGEARGVLLSSSRTYIADGSMGLTILNVSNPANPVLIAPASVGRGDTCYAVDVSPNYTFLASGHDGIRVVHHSGTIYEIAASPFDTPGSARDVKFQDNKIFVADSSGVYVYDTTGLPVTINQIASLTSGNMETMGIDVVGDMVFIANGQYGFLLWDYMTGGSENVPVSGFCNDVFAENGTIYISDSEYGLRIFDYSKLEDVGSSIGYYSSEGSGLGVSRHNDTVCLADGEDGLYVLESDIQPSIGMSADTLNFGPIPFGESRTLILWIVNHGTAMLTGNIEPHPYVAEELQTSVENFQIPRQDTLLVFITFTPKTTYPLTVLQEGSIIINTNDPDIAQTYMPVTWMGGRDVKEDPYLTDDACIGLWHLDESTGATAIVDASGNDLGGQVVGTPVWETSSKSNFGNAINFNGNYGRIQVPYNDLFNFYNSTFSIELWFNIASKPTGYATLLQRGQSHTLQYQVALAGDAQEEAGLYARTQDDEGTFYMLHTGSMADFSTNQWYHVAFTWDSDSLRLYLNGILKDKTVLRGNLVANSTDVIAIASRTDGVAHFSGSIDEIRISDLARQPWEQHVAKSRLVIENTTIYYGDVFVQMSRRIPFTFKNVGEDSLYVYDIFSPSSQIELSFESEFVLGTNEQAEIWSNFTAVSTGPFGPDDKIVIHSSDPTFPYFELPCKGQRVDQLTADPYPSDAFSLGLYHLDENSGTTIVDSSGNFMNGTGSGVSWSLGNFSRSLVFDNPSDIGVIKPQSGVHHLGPDLGGFSVETWFYMETIPSGKSILVGRGDEAGSQFDLHLSGNKVEAIFCNTLRDTFLLTSQALTMPLEAQKWYHTAVTYRQDSVLNRGTMHLFVNGEEVDQTIMTGRLAGTEEAVWVDTLSVRIGRDWNMDAPFSGRIDEVRISQIDRQFWEFNMKLARLSLSADSVLFGNVQVGNQRSMRVWFKNQGKDALHVTNLVPNNANFLVNVTHLDVAPYDSQYVDITYLPLTAGNHSGLLSMDTNDPLSPTVLVFVKGTGVVGTPVGAYEADSFTLALFDCNTIHGDTLVDGSGRGHHGFLRNGVSQTDPSNGFYDNGLYFNGLNGWVEIPSHADFNFDIASESFTLECLFKTDTVSQTMIYKGSAGTPNYGLSIDSQGRLVVDGFVSVLTNPESKFPINDRAWHHIAFIYEQGDTFARLLVGGNLYDSLEVDVNMDMGSEPLSLGSAGGTTGYFHGFIDQVRISNLARETWEFPESEALIYLLSSDPNIAVFGQNVSLRLQVAQELNASEVAVYHRRKVGRGSYQKTVGIQDTVDLSLYEVRLLSSSIYPDEEENLQGIEYYISVTTQDSIYTIPANDPKNNPKALVVRYRQMTAGVTFHTQEREDGGYQTASMFSIPFSPDETSAEKILSDLGEYDPYKWNLYKYDGEEEGYWEYVANPELFNMVPGQSFWLVMPMAQSFQIGSGVTIPSDWSYTILLSPGWNMVGTPYNQRSVWNAPSSLINTLYCWNGTDYDTCTVMEPWKGYWIHNPGTVSEILYLSPSIVTLEKTRFQHSDPAVSGNVQADWVLNFSAQATDFKDGNNHAGVHKNALSGRDRFDKVEPPPPVGRYISLFFDHRDWQSYPGVYSEDIRQSDEEGYVWPIVIRTNMADETVRLSWHLQEHLPPTWQAYLFDPEEGFSTNIIKDNSLELETGSTEPNQRIMKLVVGTEEFIENERDGISLEPHEFALFQNYPNPFNPSTEIRYSLPRKTGVKIVVYNSIGQQVRVLLDTNQKAGIHQVVWDGRDHLGRAVASGLYFCKLKTAKDLAIRKMIILK